ncbi:hypothetical protein ACQ856_18390 [Mycolicibacterium psychrotolerans]|uniref:hypothetical protein n=1 Tax=Mycolicibacterium psychrotolerans TaxID=216929 RepID=UPI003D6644A4
MTLEYKGHKWEIPKDRGLWDMNVGFEFEEGRKLRGLFTLLGGSPAGVEKARRGVYAFARTATEVDEFMDYCTEFLNENCTG